MSNIQNIGSINTSVGGEFSHELSEIYDAGVLSYNTSTCISKFEEAYKKDKTAQRIIETPIYDAMTNWRENQVEFFAELDRTLAVRNKFIEALIKARSSITGVSVIYPVLVNTTTNRIVGKKKPIDKLDGLPIEIRKLHIFTGDITLGKELITDATSDDFGKPKFIKIGDEEFHSSRLIIVGDWDCPYYLSISGYLSDYHKARSSKRKTVKRNRSFLLRTNFDDLVKYATAKGKLEGTGSSDVYKELCRLKAEILRQNLSEDEAGVIGMNEDVINLQASTIKDLIEDVDQEGRTLCGLAGGLPFSRIFGRLSGGLSGSGIEVMENYSTDLRTFLTKDVEPGLKKWDGMVSIIYNLGVNTYLWNDTAPEEIANRLRGQETQVGNESG